MGIETPGAHLFDLRDEDRLRYNPHGVAKVHSTSDAGVWFARLYPGMGLELHTHTDCEDDALVLSGTLSYHLAPGRELVAPRLSWVVARPGEEHGYENRSEKPVTLLLFSPLAAPGKSQLTPRFFQPHEEPKPRAPVYQTDASKGERLALRPGEACSVNGVRFQAAVCMNGRIMCIMKDEKLALEAGEGVVLIHKPAEFIGASGISEVSIFSTRF